MAELRRVVQAGRAADGRVAVGDAPAAEEVIWRAEARRAGAAGRGGAVGVRGGVGLGSGWLGRRVVRSRRGRSRRRDLMAAAALVVVCVGGWQVAANMGSYRAVTAPAFQEFATGPGETEIVRLTDGTVIRLGPESALGASVGETARDATLRGEAFFAVAADALRPFRIETAAGVAQVLGTRFHLSARADELAVTVVEGRVALAGPGHEVQVGAGQATRLLGGRPEPIRAAAPVERVADWMDGFLIFHDTPLDAAMLEVERLYGAQVVVDDAALLGRTLTMWFDSKSLSEVMTVVCSAIDARCSIGESVVRVEAAAGGAAS